MEVLKPLAIGFCFGWLLQRAGLSRYDRIVNVYRLRDLAVIQFMLSALVVGALALRVLAALGLAGTFALPTTYVWGVLLGGVVFGVGMALSGFCPGTVAAGAGEGRIDYLVPGFLGLFAGALVFGWLYPAVMPRLQALGNLGPVTIADALGVQPWLVLLILAELVLWLFYALERGRPVGPPAATKLRAHDPSSCQA